MDSRITRIVAWGGIGLIALAIFSVWVLPSLVDGISYTGSPTQSFVEAEKARNDLRHSIVETCQVIVTIITGAAVVYTLYLTNQNIRLTNRNVEATERTAKTAEENARKNFEMQREGRISERLTKAIDQLSSATQGVRVGAIHVLARLARESADDYWPIVELLTAVLRDQRQVTQSNQDTGRPPPEDIKAIASFLRLRKTEYEQPGQFIDVTLTVLHHINFDDAQLAGADFSGSQLQGASFKGANLRGATFVGVNAAGAIFTGADLGDSFLNGSDFTRAQMEHADLANARMEGAIFEFVVGPIKNVTEEQRRSAKKWSVEAPGPSIKSKTPTLPPEPNPSS